ncbi:membrane protein implicated in regulation of membrane protease activity [Peribacillus sp. B2I2]
MVDYSYEKQHLKKLRTFIYITIALIFSMLFIFISIFLLYFSMSSILDVVYFPPKLAIFSFIISIVFSVLAIKNLFGKILLVLNIFLMLFMIFYGP